MPPSGSLAQTTTAGVARATAGEDEGALLEGLQRGDPAARRELFERFAPHVQRVLARCLGRDGELADALHDTFVQAYGSVGSVRAPEALRGWLTMVAVYTARGLLRRRRVRRLLRFGAPEDLPDPPAPGGGAEDRWAVARVYAVLDGMPVDERLAFALRFIEGMTLTEIAEACGCSLATVKRRLERARPRFLSACREDRVLAAWSRDEDA